MKVEIIFDDRGNRDIIIDMPLIPIPGDEFKIQHDFLDEDKLYDVPLREFVINNGKLEKVRIFLVNPFD